MPAHGDKVQIKPAIPHPVLYAPGRFLDAAGMEVVWTPFLDARLATGEIEIVHSEEQMAELRQKRFNAGQIELAPRVLESGESLVPAASEPIVNLVGHVTADQAAALEGLGVTLSSVKE